MESQAPTTTPPAPEPAQPRTGNAPGATGLRAWVLKALDSPHAHLVMAVVAVVDGSVFPVPPFALLGPMVLATPRKAPVYALTGTLASLVGGFIGYALGHFAAEWVKSTLGINLDVKIERFGINMTVGEILSSNLWMLALLASVLPTPFKVVAIGSGLVNVDLLSFTLAAIFGRSARMFGFCLTLAYARDFAVKRFRIELPANA